MIEAIKQKLRNALDWLKREIKKILVILGIVEIAIVAGNSLTTTDFDISIDKLPQKYNLSQIKQEYQLIDGVKLRKVVKDDWRDRIVVEVGEGKQIFQQRVFGGETQEVFTPSLKISRWDEVNFELNPEPIIGSIPLESKKLNFIGKRIEYITPKKELHFYNIKPNEKLREGGYEFEVILKEKPSTNKLEFTINTKGLKFYYQPPMTEEKLEEGQTADETHIYDKDGNVIAERPENVVGSYAVYHESKAGDYSKMGGKNYRAGKAFHIYRPKVIDSNGNWTWGKLNIDEKKGILTIEIEQNFLDKAVYPVKVDPTFGYDTVGGSDYSIYQDHIVGSYFTGADGSATSISSYGRNTNEYKQGLYKRSDNSFVGGTEEGNTVYDPAWRTTNFSPSVNITSQDYYIVFWKNYYTGEYYGESIYYDSATGLGGDDSENYGNWPDPWSPTSQDRKYSIYCTYTAGGGEAPPPEMQSIIIE